MNPLLNRIFENKNRKKSNASANIPLSIDKVLVPKLATKTKF